jgi:nitrate/nitrite-specific signal transduction histidine kinase
MTSFITTSKETKNPVLYVNADGVIYTDPKVNVDSLRSVEKELVSFKNNETGKEYAVVFDMRKQTKLAAALGMGVTFVVMIVLALGSLALTRITYELVVTPIEAMMDKVKRIGENPLKAAAEEENEQMALEELEEREGVDKKKN